MTAWSDVHSPTVKLVLFCPIFFIICLLSLQIPYFAQSNVTHAIIQVVQIFSKYYRCYLDVRHFSSNKKNKNNLSNDFHLLAFSQILTLLWGVFSKATFIIFLFYSDEPCFMFYVLCFIYANHSYWWFLKRDETGLYNLWINFSDLFINRPFILWNEKTNSKKWVVEFIVLSLVSCNIHSHISLGTW